MNKNIITKFVLFVSLAVAFVSCEPYEDYINDYKYSAVYFGTQKPLRTLVARESSDKLNFKLGVVLSGLRENKTDQWATFEIAPDLLTTVAGASAFTLMPADWYSFSITENKISIPKGTFMGDFTISIDKAKMAANPLALAKTYAIPVRLLDASTDSILSSKNYTILVVKYISENSGTYYVRGMQTEYNNVTMDTIAGTTKKYYINDWSRNKTRVFSTLNLTDCDMAGLGFDASEKLQVRFGPNKTVTLSSSNANAAISINDMGSSFNATTKEYRFVYTYMKAGKIFKVDETLKLRNDPENDLRFEEW